MALEGPQIHFVRNNEAMTSDERLTEALELARQLEELLEETGTTPPPSMRDGRDGRDGHDGRDGPPSSASSTRMARAMAAGLVDELEALVRGSRGKTSVA